MQLFKRLLLSYFPDSLVQNTINPASMFVSFISSKDFFSIINRKIIENYKLNLFDVDFDIFEVKTGLGQEKETAQSSMTDLYYSYLAAANFNGYKFYNVANTANALVLSLSLYLQDVFEEGENVLFVDCLYAFYLLSFLFEARIKVFPGCSEQEDFNWFVELFFDFYNVVLVQLKHKITKSKFSLLRKRLLSQIEIFFLMFHYYRCINKLFSYQSPEKDYFNWLFGDQFSSSQKAFIATYTETKYSSTISLLEEDILFEVAPADIHLKYLFLENDPHLLISTLIENIYDKTFLDAKLKKLLKDPSELFSLLDYLTDPSHFKKGYFVGIQKFVATLFRGEVDEEMDEFNEMMSVIGDDMEQLDMSKIPQRIKKESRIMEQLLNFYVTYLGGLSFARADSFFLRIFHPKLISQLTSSLDMKLSTPDSINFYGLQQYFYSKNVFYYAYVNTNVRSGKEKFFLPLDKNSKLVKSNVFSLTMFDENALLILLQDINPRLTKLYVKNSALLTWFQKQWSKEISSLIKLKSSDFISAFYTPFFKHCSSANTVLSFLQNSFSELEITRLKDSLYSFDMRVFRSLLTYLPFEEMKKLYTDQVIVQIISLLRELFPGFLFYYHFISTQDAKQKKSYHSDVLIKTFVIDILGLNQQFLIAFKQAILTLMSDFSFALTLFCEFDDNKAFFTLLWENRKNIVDVSSKGEVVFSSDDLLWLRGTFKHISYYNKRYLIPA